MAATPRAIQMDGSDIAGHLHYLFGSNRGYVAFGLLDRNHTKPVMRQTFFHWPSETDDVLEFVDASRERDGVEVFIAPNLFKKAERTPDQVIPRRRIIHADVDHALPTRMVSSLRRRGFRLVASGTAGHYHVYGRLSKVVTADEHQGLLRGFRAKLGADDKIAPNDFLRVPDTTNWKNKHHDLKKRTKTPQTVTVEAPGRRSIDLDSLIEWLGDAAAPVKNRAAVRMSWDTVDISKIAGKWRRLANLDKDTAEERYGNRHNAVWGVARDMARGGLGTDEIHTLLDTFPAALDKADEEGGYNVHAHIDRALNDLDAEVEVYEAGDDFWERRDILKHIKEYAIASMANPWATLGVVMLRALHRVPPYVLMPGRNHSEAGTRALNLYVTLMGKSGGGKKTATDAGFAAVTMGVEEDMRPIGSGEGIAKSYRRRARKDEVGADSNGMVTLNTRVIFDVPEISSWNALTGRTGGTLISEVLKGFSGETLGFANADDEKTNLVSKNSYRMGLLIGAQPGMTGPLLANRDSGLPQRFLWMPTHRVQEFTYETRPKVPKPMEWVGPEWGSANHTVRFCGVADREIWEAGNDENLDELDSQAIVIRMRVACALAFLDDRREVNEEDWALSKWVMVESTRTRTGVLTSLKDAEEAKARRRGFMTATARVAEEDAVKEATSDRVTHVLGLIKKKLEADGELAASLIRKAIHGRFREHFDDALKLGIEEGMLRVRQTKNRNGSTGYHYRLTLG